MGAISTLVRFLPKKMQNTVDAYFEALDPVFALIRDCEDGRDVKTLLRGPIAHGGFSRLN